MNKQSQLVIHALQEIVSNPRHDEKMIASYFAASYQQQVDGKCLDYPGFVSHMALLKTLTRQMEVLLLSVVAERDTVFTHHRVKVEKCDNTKSEIEVMARFTLESDHIIRCEELTRLVSGNKQDHDLGSRS